MKTLFYVDEEDFQVKLKLSNLPAVTQDTHRFDRWQYIENREAGWKAAYDLCTGKARHPFLTLVGPSGTGKTHLALAAAWYMVERGITAAYWQVESLLDDLRRSYQREQRGWEGVTAEDKINFLKRCSLLVLDDLGAEKETTWSGAKLDEVVDHRYVNHGLMIVTTNGFTKSLPPRIVDRLQEGVVVTLGGKSYRLDKAKQGQ